MIFCKALDEFVSRHKKTYDGLRLGQRFVNYYVKESWPELFYEDDDLIAKKKINNWLIHHHYYSELPVRVGRT